LGRVFTNELHASFSLQPDRVRHFYGRARNRSPQVYNDYSFEQWVGFLLQQSVIVFESEQYAITRCGREFLGFVTSQGLPTKPHSSHYEMLHLGESMLQRSLADRAWISPAPNTTFRSGKTLHRRFDSQRDSPRFASAGTKSILVVTLKHQPARGAVPPHRRPQAGRCCLGRQRRSCRCRQVAADGAAFRPGLGGGCLHAPARG
jgi:hypothetical protein